MLLCCITGKIIFFKVIFRICRGNKHRVTSPIIMDILFRILSSGKILPSYRMLGISVSSITKVKKTGLATRKSAVKTMDNRLSCNDALSPRCPSSVTTAIII